MVDRRRFLVATATAFASGAVASRAAAAGGAAPPLEPPAGPIRVAHLVSERTTAFDFVGPWDVFAFCVSRSYTALPRALQLAVGIAPRLGRCFITTQTVRSLCTGAVGSATAGAEPLLGLKASCF